MRFSHNSKKKKSLEEKELGYIFLDRKCMQRTYYVNVRYT